MPKVANITDWLEQGCHAKLTGRELYAKQDLFSIYVHRSPGAPGALRESIFHGRDIEDRCAFCACFLECLCLRACSCKYAGNARACQRTATSSAPRMPSPYCPTLPFDGFCTCPSQAKCRIQGVFAQPALVEAHRRLLAAALQDERNSMFVLVSESCIPLYHPALFWAQLQSESHISRMGDGMFGGYRWAPEMATELLQPGHFRKNAQWSSLTRMHAQLAAYDEHVWPQFQAFCRTLVCFYFCAPAPGSWHRRPCALVDRGCLCRHSVRAIHLTWATSASPMSTTCRRS